MVGPEVFEKIALDASRIVFCIHIGLRVEARIASVNSCSFWGKEGFQVKLILFVSVGFCELLRWQLKAARTQSTASARFGSAVLLRISRAIFFTKKMKTKLQT